jgi:hypothetical protein
MELPRVMIKGVWYFRDDRLREYRRCDNPHERITLAEAAMMGRTPTAFRSQDGVPLSRFTCKRCGFSVIQATEPSTCFCTDE